LKYKFKYIDKIIPEIERSIEVHLGDSVHQALEWLYTQLKENGRKNIPALDDVLVKYLETWKKNFKPDFVIVKKNLTEKDYLEKGIRFIIDYYELNKPFEDNTLELEKKIIFEIDKEKGIKIQGFIDRLVHNLETGELEIHDYKTNASHPRAGHGETDRQLALYAIAIKEIFNSDKEIKLVWHFLAHNKKLVSKATDERLKKLKKETLELISEIENSGSFPPNKSPLCNWCEYKDICPIQNNTEHNVERARFFKQKGLRDF
jgi:putative RecB family exonuclease